MSQPNNLKGSFVRKNSNLRRNLKLQGIIRVPPTPSAAENQMLSLVGTKAVSNEYSSESSSPTFQNQTLSRIMKYRENQNSRPNPN